MPVVGVVVPGAAAAVAGARGLEADGRRARPIAVLATEATVASDAYGRAIRALDPDREVLHIACPLFVPLAEEGWIDNEVARAAAERYLAPVRRSGARVVVLGCTHYPLLRATIAGGARAGNAPRRLGRGGRDGRSTPCSLRRRGEAAGGRRGDASPRHGRLRAPRRGSRSGSSGARRCGSR